MSKRAVLYLRLSATADDSTSMVRQEDDLRGLADREGWDVVRVLTDDGVSGRKSRANAAEALAMLRDGDADVLAVWKLDRWTRQGLGAVAGLVEVLDAKPSAIFAAHVDGLRSDQPAWRLIAGVLAEVARMEAENTSTRIRSSFVHRKRVGKFTGGPIPYGYRSAPAPDGVGRVLEVEPTEAALVLEVADRIAIGDESLTRIARDLTGQGIPTSKSDYRRAALNGQPDETLDRGRWTVGTIRSIWSSDHLLGRTRHHGKPVLGDDGLPEAFWEPILDLTTLGILRTRLGDPRARLGRPPRVRTARLLSGIAYCAHCDSKLYVHTSSGRAVYACPDSRNAGPCPSPRIDAENLEAYIAGVFLSHSGRAPETRDAPAVADAGTSDALVEIEAALAETTGALASDDANVPALLSRLEALKARRAELRALPTTVATLDRVPTGRTIAEAWDADDDLATRRKLLLEVLDHITVSSRVRRGPKLDPERVRIRWTS